MTKGAPISILWDMDGVLIDSDKLHADAYRTVFKSIDREPPHYDSIRGQTTRATFAKLGFEEPELSRLTSLKQVAARQNLKNLRAYEGALECLRLFKELKIFQGIVTGASRAFATQALNVTGLSPYVSLCVTAESPCPSKPDAAPFLLAAQEMKLNIENVLVIEDSLPTLASLTPHSFRGLYLKTSQSSENHDKAIQIWTHFEDLRRLVNQWL